MKTPYIDLIYIGDEFYVKSGTMMSSIYTTKFERTDWGKVQIALANGKKIRIRPANDAELGRAYRMLNEARRDDN